MKANPKHARTSAGFNAQGGGANGSTVTMMHDLATMGFANKANLNIATRSLKVKRSNQLGALGIQASSSGMSRQNVGNSNNSQVFYPTQHAASELPGSQTSMIEEHIKRSIINNNGSGTASSMSHQQVVSKMSSRKDSISSAKQLA